MTSTDPREDSIIEATGETLRQRIENRIRAVRGIMFFERLWPRLLPLIGVAALFAVASWIGLFRLVPDPVRIILLVVFVAAGVASIFALRGLRWPERSQALRRLEMDNAVVHQALAAQSDRLEQGDGFARSLWRRHQARMAEKVAAIRLPAPRPATPRLDPYAMRVLVALVFVSAFGYSYSNQAGLITDAFRSHVKPAEIAGIRVDAWVTPPEYTGRAPIFLTGNRTGLPDTIAIPQGSEMLVRIIGGDGSEEVVYQTAEADIPMTAVEDEEGETAPAKPQTVNTQSFRLSPTESGSLVVRRGLNEAENWQFSLIADKAPVIAFEGNPERALNGALEIAYSVEDDYGAVQAYAEILPVTPAEEGANPLYGLPEYPLTLPRAGARQRKGRESRDLTEHPMAGMRVNITLVAEDSIGQVARSETIETTLPGRFFNNLLAGAVAEQRQVLALDSNQLFRVLDLNDAITIAPEETIKNSTHYLLIKSARSRIKQSFNDDMYRDAADYLWDIAIGIEDGNLSFAERRLRDAQRALSEALENGASDETIQALMDELREAMQEFLQALAENMQPNQQTTQLTPELQNMLRSQDLQRMLDQIENLAQSGARDQAQQLLSELQRMMNNLQMGRQQQQQAQGDNPMRQQLDKLGELMQRQQQLMDQTFDLEQALRDRQRRGPQQEDGQQGEQDQMTEEQLRQALRDLQDQQQALQDQLAEMQEALEGMGMPRNEGFDEAGEAMGEAGEALGDGQGEQAVGQQGRALQALRDGAQSMMQQMQQAMGANPGMMNNGPGSRNPTQLDPLGRPQANTGPDFGDDVKIPEEADIQRARRILEAIRERLGDAFRPEMERFYLERLLDTRR